MPDIPWLRRFDSAASQDGAAVDPEETDVANMSFEDYAGLLEEMEHR